jgi:hypothetical protein
MVATGGSTYYDESEELGGSTDDSESTDELDGSTYYDESEELGGSTDDSDQQTS